MEDDTMDPPALPAPERPDRPRGRHEAPRGRLVGAQAGAAIAVAVLSVMVAGVLATRLIGSAEPAREPAVTARAAGDAAEAGPTSRLPGAGAYGNLVPNWSFEQDLSGWEVLGAADSGREPQGHTSGSCALVRARGPEPGPVGLALPQVAPTVKRGERYVASAWVRSAAPGQRVVIRLVGAGGKERSGTATTTLPGLAWRRVIVAHTVGAGTDLRLEIVADAVPAGETLLVDEVVVRLG
jgi:carbohydrate binding protein with CBM4/9 domain